MALYKALEQQPMHSMARQTESDNSNQPSGTSRQYSALVGCANGSYFKNFPELLYYTQVSNQHFFQNSSPAQ
jgi:hypothetical protein